MHHIHMHHVTLPNAQACDDTDWCTKPREMMMTGGKLSMYVYAGVTHGLVTT